MLKLRKLGTDETKVIFGTGPVKLTNADTSFDVNNIDMAHIDQIVRENVVGEYLQLVGSGASKNVYALNDDYVLKVDSKNRSQVRTNQVAKEINVWLKSDEDARQYLCPIVAYGKSKAWSIMPRISTDRTFYGDRTVWNAAKKTLEKAIDALEDRLGVSDYCDRNIGLNRDNFMVLLDYGY